MWPGPPLFSSMPSLLRTPPTPAMIHVCAGAKGGPRPHAKPSAVAFDKGASLSGLGSPDQSDFRHVYRQSSFGGIGIVKHNETFDAYEDCPSSASAVVPLHRK